MIFTVDKEVPVPPHGNAKYPFGDMEVGDSFYAKMKRNTVASAASVHGKRSGMKFIVRNEGDGVRVWRTE